MIFACYSNNGRTIRDLYQLEWTNTRGEGGVMARAISIQRFVLSLSTSCQKPFFFVHFGAILTLHAKIVKKLWKYAHVNQGNRSMEERVDVDLIRDLVVRRKLTHKQISEELQRQNPGVRGLSEMSVRRFCFNHDIHRTSQISDGELDCAVFKAVSQVSFKSIYLFYPINLWII